MPRHVFAVIKVKGGGLECLFELGSRLIYASQPWWLGFQLALHSPVFRMHTAVVVGQSHPSTTDLSRTDLLGFVQQGIYSRAQPRAVTVAQEGFDRRCVIDKKDCY